MQWASGISLRVLVSSTCRVCGEWYGLVLPEGASSVAVRQADTGMCCVCNSTEQQRDNVSEIVLAAFEAVQVEQGWDAQIDKDIAVHGRLPAYDETRTCPVCGNEFTVRVHERPGRVREYCTDACACTARTWRHRGLETVLRRK